MAFTAEHASFPEKALQNKQIVAVTRELVDDVAVRNFRGAPFVCAIDSPELGTTRAFQRAYADLPPTAIEVFNKGTKETIIDMSSKGLATIIRSDFCRASKVSKGDGVLRCVVVDGMSFLQNTETLVKTAINIVDKRYASVLSVTFVVIDRQFDPAVRLETEKRGGDPAALLDFVSEYAAFKKLKTHVLAKRLYSSIKNTRMFWALFLFVPQQVCEADEADVVGRSRSAVQATTSRLQSAVASETDAAGTDDEVAFVSSSRPSPAAAAAAAAHSDEVEFVSSSRPDVFSSDPSAEGPSDHAAETVAAVLESTTQELPDVFASSGAAADGRNAGGGAGHAIAPAESDDAGLLCVASLLPSAGSKRRADGPPEVEVYIQPANADGASIAAVSASVFSDHAKAGGTGVGPDTARLVDDGAEKGGAAGREREAALSQRLRCCTYHASKGERTPRVGWIPGHVKMAVQSKKPSFVRSAVASGSCLEEADALGKTPIFEAIKIDSLEILRELIRAGADVNHACKGGMTPLSLAAIYGRVEMIRLLLDAKANPFAQCFSGETAHDFAQLHPRIVDDLGPGPPRSAPIRGEARACCGFHDPLLQGAPPSHGLVVGPVRTAVREKDPSGVIAAVASGGCTEELYQHEFGLTPLFEAIRIGDIEVFRALVKAGANVNHSNGGITPISYAVIYRRVTMVEELRQKGADPCSMSFSGETAFDFGRGSPDILDVLGPKPPSSAQAALGRPQRRCCYFHDREHEHPRGLRMQVGSVSKAVRERDAPGVTAAVAAGGCTEDASQCNETPLFSAVAAENVAIVQALVNAGADVNAKDTWGNTPLFMAIMRCNVTIVSILLRKEANPYTRNMSNTTPLEWVHENLKRPGVPDILGLLEENIRRLQEGNEVDDLRS